METSTTPKKTVAIELSVARLIAAGLVIVLLVLSFWAGTMYGRHHEHGSNRLANPRLNNGYMPRAQDDSLNSHLQSN